jgi:uncharacterized protein (DUF2164 family)|tara:strand:- start:81 stop:317 length:237 start_codon:yes stop_codon:yes gene_type:complete
VKEIRLTDERRDALIAELQTLFAVEFDEPISDFRAGEIMDLMLKTLGATVYNQAVEDVRAHLQGKLDDLQGEVFISED